MQAEALTAGDWKHRGNCFVLLGGVGASASAPAVFADAPQHPAPQDSDRQSRATNCRPSTAVCEETPSQVNSDFVEVRILDAQFVREKKTI